MKIFVSNEPKKDSFLKLDKFCAVINVSDTSGRLFDFDLTTPYYWFPINEISIWSYEVFYAVQKVANHYKNYSKPLLIHCHAGANRSPSMAYAIYLAAKEMGIEHKIIFPEFKINWFQEVFELNINKGHIPRNIIEFLKLTYQFPENSVISLLNRLGKDTLVKIVPKYMKEMLL